MNCNHGTVPSVYLTLGICKGRISGRDEGAERGGPQGERIWGFKPQWASLQQSPQTDMQFRGWRFRNCCLKSLPGFIWVFEGHWYYKYIRAQHSAWLNLTAHTPQRMNLCIQFSFSQHDPINLSTDSDPSSVCTEHRVPRASRAQHHKLNRYRLVHVPVAAQAVICWKQSAQCQTELSCYQKNEETFYLTWLFLHLCKIVCLYHSMTKNVMAECDSVKHLINLNMCSFVHGGLWWAYSHLSLKEATPTQFWL